MYIEVNLHANPGNIQASYSNTPFMNNEDESAE